MMGTGKFAETQPECPEYRRGYLCGIIRGDGTLRTYCYDGRRRQRDRQHHFRLALIDFEALSRARRFLSDFELQTHEFVFKKAAGAYSELRAIRTHSEVQVGRITDLIGWPDDPGVPWIRGFLAGIFDAEG